MKYCSKCGAEIAEEAVVCPKCGCPIKNKGQLTGLQTAVKVFMILACIVNAFAFLIPLCWCIPMTNSYVNKRKNGEPVSVGFKICSLLFVSFIGGILMLCDKDE